MVLKLYIVYNCPTCLRAIETLKDLVDLNNSLKLEIVDISNLLNSHIQIVPALYLNENLFCYGDIDIERLKKFIPCD